MSDGRTSSDEVPGRGRAASCRGPSCETCPPRRLRRIARLTLLALGLVMAGMLAEPAAQERHSNPWLLTWIPPRCCVTNDCCWEIAERELRPLPDDQWEVRATGQVRPRTDWSPDGKFYRCACDYDAAGRRWVRHAGANTRCLFVPLRAVSR